MSPVRAFVAIHLDDKTRDAVARAQAKLKQCGAAVRWVKPESMHLTLKFLGEIEMEAVPGVAAIMAEAVEGVEPFTLTFRGLNALPRIESPRVVYVGVGDEGSVLAPIADRLNDRLCALGVKRENRRFKAHLTIGRVKSRKKIEPLIELIRAEPDTDYGAVDVTRICLMRSELKPTGAEYTVLHTADL